MSGHAGFSPIGNNIPRPIVNNVPVVDGNANADNRVNNVPGGGEPQRPDEAPIRAADVAGQLDILLFKAVKTVAVPHRGGCRKLHAGTQYAQGEALRGGGVRQDRDRRQDYFLRPLHADGGREASHGRGGQDRLHAPRRHQGSHAQPRRELLPGPQI